MTQLPLFPRSDFDKDSVPDKFGRAEVASVEASSILTKPTGFIKEYDFSLNPYSGCAFGCTYCYAAFFARDEDARDRWGDWVTVKNNAIDKLRKMRRSLTGKTIYMSSVTDPYQPIEKKLGLVRGILEELIDKQPRLVVQTRSPLVMRDVDLLARFEVKQVNMTVTTDSDAIRKQFEPYCASTEQRLDAIAKVHQAGIPSCITMTPLLPIDDPAGFAKRLRETGVEKFVTQSFSLERGKFVAGTRDEALALAKERDWNEARYREVYEVLEQELPSLSEGRSGFAPV